MEDLQTLILIDCDNPPFARSLDPKQNRYRCILCPSLKETVIFFKTQSEYNFCAQDIISMANCRALQGVKVSSIKVVGRAGLMLEADFPSLEEHVGTLKYVEGGAPA